MQTRFYCIILIELQKYIKTIKMKIQKLDTFDFPNRELKADGYDTTSVPKATPDNMIVLINKINELTKVVNKLKKKL